METKRDYHHSSLSRRAFLRLLAVTGATIGGVITGLVPSSVYARGKPSNLGVIDQSGCPSHLETLANGIALSLLALEAAGKAYPLLTFVSGTLTFMDIQGWPVCDRYNLEDIKRKFGFAFDEADAMGIYPGDQAKPVMYVNAEYGGDLPLLIHEIWGGTWGAGAILLNGGYQRTGVRRIAKFIPGMAYYVGGGSWNAYQQARYDWKTFPGYPINTEHDWDGVKIQDFRGGNWGEAALIGGARARWVAGKHWSLYKSHGGPRRFGNPVGYSITNGWHVQTFERGTIKVLNWDRWEVM